MAHKVAELTPAGAALDAATAQSVFGWKNVHTHDGVLVGKKPDRAGRWRRAKVPNYSTDPLHAYLIDQRMEQLGRSERYLKELAKLIRGKNLPADWATPEQRARAALKVMRK
jgi:hypothetical protein